MQNKRQMWHLWLFTFTADLCAVVAAYYTTWLLRFRSDWGFHAFTVINRILGVRETGFLGDRYEVFYYDSAPRIILFLTLTLCVLYALCGLYTERRFIRKRPIAGNVILANAIALGLFYAYFYLRRNVFHPRSYFATLLFLNVIFCGLFRHTVDSLLDSLRRRFAMDRCHTLLVGQGEEASFLNVLIEESHPHGIQIVDRVEYNPDESIEGLVTKIRASDDRNSLHLIVCADLRIGINEVMRILEVAGTLGLYVKVLSDKLDVLVSRAGITTDIIHTLPLVHFDIPGRQRLSYVLRRAAGLLFTAVAVVLLLPLMALIALLVTVTSRGAPLFVQERIGVNRKPFRMYKFRTMYDRSAELQAQVEEFNESGEGLFKIRRDPRITPVGRLLRRFSLDELPQLFNILHGDMVLVGPRPLPRRDFENYYEEWHYNRHEGMPGLTCLWQVSGRSDIDFHNMCILDVYYLRNQNWVLDLQIFLKTFYVVLFAKGAY